MSVSIDRTPDAHFPAWIVRLRVGRSWFQVHNIVHPDFWVHWWTMFRGKRAWAIRWYVRHLVIWLETSV